MLADHMLAIEAPADAYELKRGLYDLLSSVGVTVEARSFIYGRCPIDGTVIIRGSDEQLAEISTYSKPAPQPETDKTYDFCLRATPMHQTTFGIEPDNPVRWLSRRADKYGVEFITMRHRFGWTWCSKPTKENTPGFYLPDVVYLGQLKVKDADKLTNALTAGIGRHRAFGFGLLQLFD